MQNRVDLHHNHAETEDSYRRAAARVICAMHENLDRDFTLADMAQVAYMSPFHLNRIFRQVTGLPPRRFLTALRLEAAKRLLLTSALSVTDISLEVGYNSLGTFTRRFAELVGLSPSRFRKLKDEGARTALNSLREIAALARFEPLDGGVSGRVEVPDYFRGAIFVGLFSSAVPQSRPKACALLTTPGSFRLSPVPDGSYYLRSAGLAWSFDPREYLLYEKALRGGTALPLRIQRGVAKGSTHLTLQAPQVLDPPILMTIPLLVKERLARPTPFRPLSVADAAVQPARVSRRG